MRRSPWWPAALHALPVAASVLALFATWFAVADRYIVFLYYHPMGPRVPDTSPFSRVTSSRYWMAGLVASGAVLVLYAVANWALGRLRNTYASPPWWRVWLLTAPLLVVGIPAITMTANHPVLPLPNAAQTTAVTLAGIALALVPGRLAAERPGELVWLAFDGFGLTPVLLLGSFLFWPLTRAGLSREQSVSPIPVAGLLFSATWLLVGTGLRVWRQAPTSSWLSMLVAGFDVSYLLLPLLHHVGFTDGYTYITNSDNFFDRDALRRTGAWLLTAALAWGVSRFRRLTDDQRVGRGARAR